MNTGTDKDMYAKDTGRIGNAYKSCVRLSDKDNKVATYIAEKASRITAVLTMLASNSKGHDELMKELERSAVRLVSHASRTMVSDKDRTDLLVEIRALVVVLDVGVRVGRIAGSNAGILTDELMALADFIRDIEWERGRVFIPAEHLYVSPPQGLESVERIQMTNTTLGGQIKDTMGVAPAHKETSLYGARERTEKDIPDTGHKKGSERMQDAQKDRRATILGMLQRKDRVSVRDVANVIKDCSEKTLQRELLALVGQGVLVKEGERRWSTYRLA
jgi:hypothetical protein